MQGGDQNPDSSQNDGEQERVDDRPPTVRAANWATRITSVSLMMVVPGLLGYWADLQLGILPGLTVAGFALGMTVGIYQLIRITAPKK